MARDLGWLKRQKRILVTGAGGFIGSHLVDRLVREGARVRAFVRYNSAGDRHNLELLEKRILDEIEIVAGDLTDPHFVEQAVKGCETVFHLASLIAIPYSYIAPASYVQTNVTGSTNLFQACLRGDTSRIVHTSTSEVYGTARYTPIDETHPLQAQSPYAATKIAADKLAESYYRGMGLPVTIIRPFNTYGPRQSARAVIPTIVSQLLSGADVLRLGSLDPVRDFLFVDDTVEGFLAGAASEESIGTVTNLGTGRGVTIGELAEMAMAVTGSRAEVVCDERRVRPEEGEVMALICDASNARRRFGWQSTVELESGLRAVADFVAAHPDRFRPSEFSV